MKLYDALLMPLRTSTSSLQCDPPPPPPRYAQTLHDGMPGFGPRRLRVMLLDEVAIPQSLDTLLSGILDLGETDPRK
jgi:hypothetical protein